jgi:hypothetical protein
VGFVSAAARAAEVPVRRSVRRESRESTPIPGVLRAAPRRPWRGDARHGLGLALAGRGRGVLLALVHARATGSCWLRLLQLVPGGSEKGKYRASPYRILARVLVVTQESQDPCPIRPSSISCQCFLVAVHCSVSAASVRGARCRVGPQAHAHGNQFTSTDLLTRLYQLWMASQPAPVCAMLSCCLVASSASRVLKVVPFFRTMQERDYIRILNLKHS